MKIKQIDTVGISLPRKVKRMIQGNLRDASLTSIYRRQGSVYELYMNLLLDKSNVKLFITHDNGGGTYLFEREYLKDNDNVIVLRRLHYPYMEDKFFSVVCPAESSNLVIMLKDLKTIFTGNFTEIIVNSLDSYQNYELIINLILGYMQAHTKTTLKYFVHDYNCVCPTTDLVIDSSYCKLMCSSCTEQLRVATKHIDINDWRKNWRRLLGAATEICCFSNSTKEIIKSIYSDISLDKITVRPHDTSYCRFKPLTKVDRKPLCIGIVGNITTVAKGKNVVTDILDEFGDQVDIRIIGASFWNYRLRRKKARYLGKYERNNLGTILFNESVNFLVFPSICPETFSYLVSELICFDLPIVSFDIGAQAEKIRSYSKGIICNNEQDMLNVIRREIESS